MKFNLPLSLRKRSSAVVFSVIALSAGAWALSQSVQPVQAAASKSQVERITAAVNESLGASGVKVVSVSDIEFIDGLFEVVVNHNGTKKSFTPMPVAAISFWASLWKASPWPI